MRFTILIATMTGLGVGLLWQLGHHAERLPPVISNERVSQAGDTAASQTAKAEETQRLIKFLENDRQQRAALKKAFMELDDAQKQLAERRKFVEMFQNWAPYEATRCRGILNEVDMLIAKMQSQVISASNNGGIALDENDVKRLQQLLDRFNAAVADFQKAGSKHR